MYCGLAVKKPWESKATFTYPMNLMSVEDERQVSRVSKVSSLRQCSCDHMEICPDDWGGSCKHLKSHVTKGQNPNKTCKTFFGRMPGIELMSYTCNPLSEAAKQLLPVTSHLVEILQWGPPPPQAGFPQQLSCCTGGQGGRQARQCGAHSGGGGGSAVQRRAAGPDY